ncbi:interleukin-13 receptor subunit alpha-1-like isoform X2 [Toxotes jaculatrix]|uniref:interleukin-13 receptor subunit alpha-1-like isoform X2 n=1 Tax=Toxotes jaculatrix TaxID=941984 RepID=UPI001B3AFB9E|nr:interleukin-13 receptor subunit alpha-1-like isoform X2 [Toxotes jaculatrix]
MTFTREFFTFLTSTTVIMVLHCNAARLPQPTNLSYEWLDPFTVNVSWWKPSNLPQNCEIKYKHFLVKNGSHKEDLKRTIWRNFTENCLTEEMDTDQWTYSIQTYVEDTCKGWNSSKPVYITIDSPKPRAVVVNDFKCIIHPKSMDCSWIPVDPSLALMLSFRDYGSTAELIKAGLKECDKYYSAGKRNGCHLNTTDDICFLANTSIGQSTFKLSSFEIPTPKLNIREDKDHLILNWAAPEVGTGCKWIYELCYTQCDQSKKCQNYSWEKTDNMENVPPYPIVYNENCRYEFKYRVVGGSNCIEVASEWSDVQTYGTNKVSSWTVVAIVIPIILCVCVVLSCYCFRKHSDIICPIIPDPSTIFKEMINGNRDPRCMPGNLYTPAEESFETCNILLQKS